MNYNLHISQKNNIFRITLLFILFIEVLAVRSQNVYTLDLSDPSSYNITCGKVNNGQWSVKNDSCMLYTSFFRKETDGCMAATYQLRVNQSGNGDASDIAWVQYEMNGVWVTDTILHASDHNEVHTLTGDLQFCNSDVVRFRIILKTDNSSEFWALMSEGIKFSASFTEYPWDQPPSNLPVTLLDYRVKCSDSGPVISWSTASEVNNDYFTLERSYDLLNWTAISSIAGADNSNQVISYIYTDSDADPGRTSYYRLSQTDTDGKSEYFDVLPSFCGSDKDDLAILGLENIDMQFNMVVETSSLQPIDASLYDLTGVKIANSTFSPKKGTNFIKFETTSLSDGIYIASIFQDGKIATKKFYVGRD